MNPNKRTTTWVWSAWLWSGAWLIAIPLLVGCRASAELRDFTSDGCSLFPDASSISETDWYDCCFDHDIAYWQGGTRQQRLEADDALRACVLEKTDSQELADVMYAGVRGGGSPYFYNWYRWGYGWGYGRKYQALTESEQAQVRETLDHYFAND
ncbi:MAG: FAD-binding oxidoreductase [Cellvibrionaceae bacterium]